MLTTKSFYSLGYDDHTGANSPNGAFGTYGHGSRGEKRAHGHVPPVPPIPAAYDQSKPLVLPYERSEGKFMGRLSTVGNGEFRLDYFDDGHRPGGPAVPPVAAAVSAGRAAGTGAGQGASVGEAGSVYSGIGVAATDTRMGSGGRDSMGTLDGQRWIDEYAQRRDAGRSAVEGSVMVRPLSHRLV